MSPHSTYVPNFIPIGACLVLNFSKFNPDFWSRLPTFTPDALQAVDTDPLIRSFYLLVMISEVSEKTKQQKTTFVDNREQDEVLKVFKYLATDFQKFTFVTY